MTHYSDCRVTGSLDDIFRAFIGCDEAAPLPSPYNLSEAVHTRARAAVSWTDSPDIARRLVRLGYVHSRRFAVLPSARKPRWLLPLRDGRFASRAFDIYSPSSPTAKILKSLGVLMMKAGWPGWARHSVLIASKEPLPLENLVRNVTEECQPVFALSVGVPETVRKLTLQVMNSEGEILGYIKVPVTPAAAERVRHETKVLERLNGLPELRRYIPRLLYSGLCSNRYVLFESPLAGSPGPASFTKMHSEFLRTLQSFNPVRKPGTSVMEGVAVKWERIVSQLGGQWQGLGREVLRRVSSELDRAMILCGVMHGDFTPWHTRIHEKGLSLFDWESAAWEAPASWDRLHFLAQTECLLKRKIENGKPTERMGNDLACSLLYLLHSTAQLVEEKADRVGIDFRRKQILLHLSGAN
jgi:hypothetical protein